MVPGSSIQLAIVRAAHHLEAQEGVEVLRLELPPAGHDMHFMLVHTMLRSTVLAAESAIVPSTFPPLPFGFSHACLLGMLKT